MVEDIRFTQMIFRLKVRCVGGGITSVRTNHHPAGYSEQQPPTSDSQTRLPWQVHTTLTHMQHRFNTQHTNNAP